MKNIINPDNHLHLINELVKTKDDSLENRKNIYQLLTELREYIINPENPFFIQINKIIHLDD